MNNVCLNGKIMPGDEPILTIANRSFRYGDALFETMKLTGGKIPLVDYHFKRLFTGLTLLKIGFQKFFTKEKLINEVTQLCKRNKCESLARIRLTGFRSDDPANSL